MTKQDAMRSICQLSCGTIATLTGIRNYEEQGIFLAQTLDKIETIDTSACESWMDVWNLIKPVDGGKPL